MITVLRSWWFIVALVVLGLEVATSGTPDKRLQACGFWLGATALLYGSGSLVLWPKQMVARNPGEVGTHSPRVARGFGVFGLLMAVFFEALASAWSDNLHWPTFLLATTASGLCAAVALKNLGRILNAKARPDEAEATKLPGLSGTDLF